MNFVKGMSGIKRLQVLAPPLPWDKPRVREGLAKSAHADQVVVCLHGLWRSVWAMEPMATHLNKEGFTTVNIPYASFRYELDEIVQRVRQQVQPWLDEGKQIHFVTHSLGGVVLKQLLENSLVDDEKKKIGRVVMLAPPHQGSEIVDWLRNSPVRYVLGPAGEFLSTTSMEQHSRSFPEDIEAAVIMGEKSAIPFFRKLLDASNDGIVSVKKGRLLGIKEFKVVDADHTFIASEPQVYQLVQQFLESGKLER